MQSSLLNQLNLNFYNIITHPIMYESLYMHDIAVAATYSSYIRFVLS